MTKSEPTIKEDEAFEKWLDKQLTGDWAQDDMETNLRMAVSTIRDMPKQTPKDFAVQPLIRYINRLMDKREIKALKELPHAGYIGDDGLRFEIIHPSAVEWHIEKLEQQLKRLEEQR